MSYHTKHSATDVNVTTVTCCNTHQRYTNNLPCLSEYSKQFCS